MSFFLWHRGAEPRLGASRLVLRAAEVPLLKDALTAREALVAACEGQQAQIDAAAEQARAAGREAGIEQGRQEAAQEHARTLAALAAAAAEERDRLRGEAGALALQVVRKLLGSFAPDEVLAALAATAAQELIGVHSCTLRVHPEAEAGVRARLVAQPPLGLACEVRADADLAAGACRLETGHGSVDASLDAQLARLAEAWSVPGARPAR